MVRHDDRLRVVADHVRLNDDWGLVEARRLAAVRLTYEVLRPL